MVLFLAVLTLMSIWFPSMMLEGIDFVYPREISTTEFHAWELPLLFHKGHQLDLSGAGKVENLRLWLHTSNFLISIPAFCFFIKLRNKFLSLYLATLLLLLPRNTDCVMDYFVTNLQFWINVSCRSWKFKSSIPDTSVIVSFSLTKIPWQYINSSTRLVGMVG